MGASEECAHEERAKVMRLQSERVLFAEIVVAFLQHAHVKIDYLIIQPSCSSQASQLF